MVTPGRDGQTEQPPLAEAEDVLSGEKNAGFRDFDRTVAPVLPMFSHAAYQFFDKLALNFHALSVTYGPAVQRLRAAL